MDARKVRPRDGWLVVLSEPRQVKLASGIFLPNHETGAEKMREGAGTIVRTGPGEKNTRLGLEVGQRVLYRGFLKWANPIETDEKWPDGQPLQYFIMSNEDILAVIPEGVEVGVFSGRPQAPERKNG